MYFQWWRKANGGEQFKGENCIENGLIPSVGYKGTDEFEELKISLQNRNDLIVELKNKLDVLVGNLVGNDDNVISGVKSVTM